MIYRLLVTSIEVDDHPVTGKDYLHFGVAAHNKIYSLIILQLRLNKLIRSSLESRIARLEKQIKMESKDYPTAALQDLISIAKVYDQLNDKFSSWFDKYYKVSNDLYYSAENVLKNEYGEVPLMFRHTRSVDEELSNESCLRENASAILEQLNDELF